MHHVGIVVADLAEATRFVTEVLGLAPVREFDVPELRRHVVFYDCGTVQLELIDELEAGAKKSSLGSSTAILEHIALEVDDFEATVARVVSEGVRIDMKKGVIEAASRLNAWTEPATSGGVIYQLVGRARSSRNRLASESE